MSIQTSTCNVRGNVSLHFLGDLGVYLLIIISMTTRARDFKFGGVVVRIKVVVGNGGLNSKSVFSALCMVLSWKVTY